MPGSSTPKRLAGSLLLLAMLVPDLGWGQATTSLISVLALAALSLAGLSCAYSGPRTPAGTYPITVTATGANFTRTLEVTLIVRD